MSSDVASEFPQCNGTDQTSLNHQQHSDHLSNNDTDNKTDFIKEDDFVMLRKDGFLRTTKIRKDKYVTKI